MRFRSFLRRCGSAGSWWSCACGRRADDYLVKLDVKAANGQFEEVEDYRFQVVKH